MLRLRARLPRLFFQPINPTFFTGDLQATGSLLLALWAILLSYTWLLPNHYMPWSAFHSDAWSAIVSGVAFAVVLLVFPRPVAWHWMPLLVSALVSVPLIQYALGLLPFAGQAWVSSAYLLGLLLALLSGARWEHNRSGQVADGLFLAIGSAAILSVGLQLHQWLMLSGFEIWSMGLSGGRPYANLGQSNQLGTLLVWGLLAAAWACIRGKIRTPFAILMACFLCIGIALTQSRTAWVGLFLLVTASWIWRKQWSSKRTPLIVVAIAVFFLVSYWAIGRVGEALLLPDRQNLSDRLQTSTRLDVWRLFIDAVWEHPWWGYGWTGVSRAHLAVALNHPSLGLAYQHAHNLFLDLVLWCGLPIGLTVSAAIIIWFVRCVPRIKNIEDVILFMFVAIVGNHAMLELPLHYAYFLLPTGMMMGALDIRLGARPVFYGPRWLFVVIWLVTLMIVSGIMRDYFRVEDNFYALRFERAHIGSLPPKSPPDVLFLTQLREQLRLARMAPKDGLSEADIERIRNVAEAFPGLSEMYKWALSLAYVGQRAEAQIVLKKACKLVSEHECEIARLSWARKSLQDSKIAAVKWPD